MELCIRGHLSRWVMSCSTLRKPLNHKEGQNMLINEQFGWFWITFGFLSGMMMGMKFQSEDWMGGYSSHPRRMLRLGHISFVGLGILNILFAGSAARMGLAAGWMQVASWSFIIGGISMPICCSLMAWQKRWQFLFAIPVIALHIGSILTFIGLLK